MFDPSRSWLQRYRSVRQSVDLLFWVVVVGLQGVLNTAVALADLRAAGLVLPWWKPVLWELSSHLMVLLLIPGIVAWNRRFPLHWDTLRRHLPWHLAGSLVFSLAHVAGMVGVRLVVHAMAGERYDFGPWLAGWLYEYLKDVRAYLLIVGVLTAHRFVLLRLQGEARVLDAPEAAPPPVVLPRGPAVTEAPGRTPQPAAPTRPRPPSAAMALSPAGPPARGAGPGASPPGALSGTQAAQGVPDRSVGHRVGAGPGQLRRPARQRA